jgi:hypothetical protein
MTRRTSLLTLAKVAAIMLVGQVMQRLHLNEPGQ